jgi:hypothetical protein
LISAEEARLGAEALLSRRGGPFQYQFVEAKLVGGEWSVVFATLALEGHEIDGPVVIRVDSVSGRARYLGE